MGRSGRLLKGDRVGSQSTQMLRVREKSLVHSPKTWKAWAGVVNRAQVAPR